MQPGLPCVHCGLCLDTCPTYRVLGTEADSPRGRIYVMEAVEDGTLELDTEAARHLDGCLGCLACETACPSGISFGRRIERFRARIPAHGIAGRWRRVMARATADGRLLTAGLLAASVLDAVGLGRMRRRVPGLGLLPSRGTRRASGPASPVDRATVAAPADPRMRVALLDGCVADRFRPQINEAAVDVLHRNRIAVTRVVEQGCCGALALHAGRHDEAARLAKGNVVAFERAGVDAVVTTAAGCGAMIKDYGRLLADDERFAAPAERLSRDARDVSELLVELGLERPATALADTGKVVYHDACHLLHVAGVSKAPRAVVEAATGVAPDDLGDNNVCCGSAGSYNVDHPRMGVELGRRKAELADRSGADTIAVGNIGCILQLERALALAGKRIVVRHPVELLAAAYRAETGVG
jgi:glycolate oxidase iron-sulfur subunit